MSEGEINTISASVRSASNSIRRCTNISLTTPVNQRQLPRRCKCTIFSTGGYVGNIWLAPNIDSNLDQPNVSCVFPNGAMSARITNFPGTICKLSHDWRAIVSSNANWSPPNLALRNLFGIEWHGNVIMMKYGKGNRQKMNNVPPAEKEFVFILLH